jgi:hypothetical protein
VNAVAPKAPVAATGTAGGGTNSKPHHASLPSSLGRGVNKGSALFQQLLSARAALKGTAALAALRASEATKEAAGLKAALVARLPKPAAPAGLPQAAGAHAAGAHAAQIVASVAKAKANVEKKKSEVPDLRVVALHAGVPARASPIVPGKEPKDGGAPGAKAPLVDAVKSVAHRAEPLIRVVDLRRHEKAPADSTSSRRQEPVPSQDRDISAAVLTRPASHERFAEAPARPAPAASPAAIPLGRLKDQAGSELLRASQLVLRDGGGEIRLVLKPESLGSVRVRMNLVDNAIEGRIIVDSAAVKHVLDGSVDALRRALTAEGFQMGSLQVSVGGQDAQADQKRQPESAPTEVRRIAAQGFERSVPGVEDLSLGDLFVNLFV